MTAARVVGGLLPAPRATPGYPSGAARTASWSATPRPCGSMSAASVPSPLPSSLRALDNATEPCDEVEQERLKRMQSRNGLYGCHWFETGAG